MTPGEGRSADLRARARTRCAVWSRDVQLDPGGTAPRCDVFVVVEHPLPWPRDALDVPLLSMIDGAARDVVDAGSVVRVQAAAAEPPQAAITLTRRVIVWRATNPFAGYARIEGRACPADLPELVSELVANARTVAVDGGVTDVLVCSHGSRDTCCGSMGTRLARSVEFGGVEVWRTSHTGGHRFAPTAITFPDGNYWSHLDAELLSGVVRRSLPASLAAGHLRGCAAFTPALQVADRAVFEQQGWSWLSWQRVGSERSRQRAEVCYRSPDGRSGTYLIALTERRTMPIPACPIESGEAEKFQAEFDVTRVQHIR